MSTAVAIPEPWASATAMSRSGTTVTLGFDRVYDFSTPFGAQFSMDVQNLLSAPATLKLQASTGGGIQTVTATPTIVSEDASRIVLTWTWTGTNGIGATGTITIDADGAITQNFTLKRTVSQKFTKIQISIPLATALCDYLMIYPRASGTADATEDLSAAWSFVHQQNSTQSAEFPRVLKVHNGSYGLEWVQETDEHWASYAASANGSITIDPDTGIWNFNVCNGNWGPSNSTADMTFAWLFTPMPTRPVAYNLPALGQTEANPEVTLFRPLSEECAGGSHWKYQGSCIPREGSWSGTTFAQKMAAHAAVGREVALFASCQLWPNADPAYLEEWRFGPGYTVNFSVNCNGVDFYQYRNTNCEFQTFVDMILPRLEHAINPAHADYCVQHIYLDESNLKRFNTTTIDQHGIARYHYIVFGLRNLLRQIYAMAQGYDALVITHPQSDFVACVHNFSDFTLPGEQLAVRIAATSNGNTRRRFYSLSMPRLQWRTELNPKVFGCSMILLPEVIDTGTNEDLATDNALAMSCIHNVGYWKSFGNGPAPQRYFSALKTFGIRDATFSAHWEEGNPVTTDDGNALVSCWRKGNQVMVAIYNDTDTDRLIPIGTALDSSAGALRYWGFGTSAAEGRTTNYTATLVSGDEDNTYQVGVGRYNLTLVEFTLSEDGGGGEENEIPVLAGSTYRRMRQ